MKIFLGSGDLGGMINLWARGFQQYGAETFTAVHAKNPFFHHVQYDADISKWDKKLFQAAIPYGGYTKSQILKKSFNLSSRFFQSLQFISQFDTFLFVTPALSIFQPNFDFRLIKLLKKNLIVVGVGSDIRHVSGFSQEFPCDETLFDDQFRLDDISRPLRNLRRAELYADLIYSVPDQSSLAIRDYNHFRIPVDVKEFTFNFPDNEIPVVLHAPSRRGIKGTDQILVMFERLKQEGIQFELRLLEKVNNRLIKEYLKDADLLVDEIVLHGPGVLSFEAMCSGCAVATKYLKSSPEFFIPPVFPTDDKNLYENLKLLLINRDLRRRLAYEGKAYVAKNNDYSIISRKIVDDLDCYNRNEIVYDYKASFFKEKYQLPENTSLPRYLKKLNLRLGKKYWSDFDSYEAGLRESNLI